MLGVSLFASGYGAFLLGSCAIAGIRKGGLEALAERGRAASRRLSRRASTLPHIRDALAERSQRKRREEMRRQMPEAVRLLCIALDSGSSLPKALDYAADNTSGALGLELRRVVWDLKAGQGFAEAMENLRARTGGSEFAYLAVAMEIQHVCGGSLGAVLESVSASLRSAAELEEEFASKTAQAKLSARVVAIMPLVLLAVLSLLSPGYLATFFSSPFGVLVLACGLVLEAAGIVCVRKCMEVEGYGPAGGTA